MEIAAKYSPAEVEDKWYQYWVEKKLFHSEPDATKQPYTIVIPPPNVTGILHMGHVLNNTLNDVLIRKARMDGKNACWVPGTDHASIATENKVVARLEKQGIKKTDLTREQFLEHAWAWKEEHGGIILNQLRKLGASCDWDRTRFTMEPELSQAVINTFCYFYDKGLIYRGVRMVNWDPERQTAVSDEEVIHRVTKSKFYYLRYFVADENGNPTDQAAIVATTRPETIMADAAVCINPEDERNHWLKGKKVIVPLINKVIPIIEDSYVEVGFGTGCLKVTPAHDLNDYELGLKHHLPVVDIIDDKGCLNEKAQILIGEDRFVAREKIEGMLAEAGCLEKVEPYESPIGYSERTNAVIEPKLSLQWFLKMEDLAKDALASVEEGRVKLIPDKYRNTYRHWMETVRDWCISRQLWWGQRIPAYYLPTGETFVAPTLEAALAKAQAVNPAVKAEDLHQDEDVLDTWFSSWLWPISVFDPEAPGCPDHKPNADLAYYYPTSDLVTGPDILFFWVARMVMAGNEFMKGEPFSNVYLTGIVRDKLGRKMSKTLGNSPDPLVLIEKYGADAVRLGMMLCSSAGNDILYDESQVEQGRNFCNKIWNAYRLVTMQTVDSAAPQTASSALACRWFAEKLAQATNLVNDHFSKYRISDAILTIYKLFWDDFCSNYLEIIKPAYGTAMDFKTFEATKQYFDALLRLLHPFMPFITEELWQNLAERGGESIMYAPYPQADVVDEAFLSQVDAALEAVIGVRNVRASKNIPQKEELTLQVAAEFPVEVLPIVEKLGNVKVAALSEGEMGVQFVVGTYKFFVPLAGKVDVEAERAKILSELEHQQKFLEGVRRKLSNEKFVAGAPEQVVALERKKEADALSRIETLTAALKAL